MAKRKKRRGHGEGTILKRKDGRWQGAVTVGYDEEGRQKRRTVYGRSQAEVREKLEKIRQQFTEGTLVDTQLTLKAYLDQWLAEKKRQVKPRTHDSYRYTIDKYLLPRLGRVKLAKLTPLRAQAALSAIADDAGARTSNLARAVLFSAMKQAVRWRILPHNPIEGVMRIKEEKRDMVIWTPEQAATFLATAQEHRLYALFYLAVGGGLRAGELIGLQWRDLDGIMLRIERTVNTRSGTPTYSTPKTDRGKRVIALAPDVLRVLKEHREVQHEERSRLGDAWPDTGHIFVTETGSILNARNVSRIWHHLQEKAGVPRARLHDARHLHVSLLVRQGLDLRTIADRVGHTDPSFTLSQYSHMFEGQRKAAAISLEEMLPMNAEEDEEG